MENTAGELWRGVENIERKCFFPVELTKIIIAITGNKNNIYRYAFIHYNWVHFIILFCGSVLDFAASSTCHRLSFPNFAVNLSNELRCATPGSVLLLPAAPVQSECCSSIPASTAQMFRPGCPDPSGQTRISPNYYTNVWARVEDEESGDHPAGRSHTIEP